MQRADAAVARDLKGERLVVPGRAAQDPGRLVELGWLGEVEADVPTRDVPLQLVRGAKCDDPALVEEGDPVGETIRLREGS